MTDKPFRRRGDPILMVEVVLVLALFVLFLVLYLVPAGSGALVPAWWAWPVLAVVFFGILVLERWRRKRRDRAELSRGVPGEPT